MKISSSYNRGSQASPRFTNVEPLFCSGVKQRRRELGRLCAAGSVSDLDAAIEVENVSFGYSKTKNVGFLAAWA